MKIIQNLIPLDAGEQGKGKGVTAGNGKARQNKPFCGRQNKQFRAPGVSQGMPWEGGKQGCDLKGATILVLGVWGVVVRGQVALKKGEFGLKLINY